MILKICMPDSVTWYAVVAFGLQRVNSKGVKSIQWSITHNKWSVKRTNKAWTLCGRKG